MKFIAKFGEHLVLTRLLQNEVEAYPAIKVNQDSYDLTAISRYRRVIRIQVKATELNNRSTNNSIKNFARHFDFLVIVVVESATAVKCFVLTHSQAQTLKGRSKQLGVSRIVNGVKVVKDELCEYLERWDQIRDAPPDNGL